MCFHNKNNEIQINVCFSEMYKEETQTLQRKLIIGNLNTIYFYSRLRMYILINTIKIFFQRNMQINN